MPLNPFLSRAQICLFFLFSIFSAISIRADEKIGFYGYIYQVEAFGPAPIRPPIAYPNDGPWFSQWDRAIVEFKIVEDPEIIADNQDALPWSLMTKNCASEFKAYTWKFYNESLFNPNYSSTFDTGHDHSTPYYQTRTTSGLAYQNNQFVEEWGISAEGNPGPGAVAMGKYDLVRVSVDLEADHYTLFPWDGLEVTPFKVPYEEINSVATRRLTLSWRNPTTDNLIVTSVHIVTMY